MADKRGRIKQPEILMRSLAADVDAEALASCRSTELLEQLGEADTELTEATAEVVGLKDETRKAMCQVRPPEPTKPSTLHKFVPRFEVSVEQLGRVAAILGLGEELATRLEAMAET
ncbi:unnamed protein product, partial [Prorocentrum cordatum]